MKNYAKLFPEILDIVHIAARELQQSAKDLRAMCREFPNEVAAFRAALDRGHVDGGTVWNGRCGCFYGHIAKSLGVPASKREDWYSAHAPQICRDAEAFLFGVSKGSTPENDPTARCVAMIIDDWLAEQAKKAGVT